MAISPFQEPGFAPSPAALPEASPAVELTEFTLALHPQPRQLALAHENPLCLLFAGLREGARVCNRGCGVAGSATQSHTCPFGMCMQRLDDPVPAGQSRWIGRRFPNIETLHGALDRLIDAGIAEDEILAALPANPVVSEMELIEEIATRNGAQIIPVSAAPTKSEIRVAKPAKKSQTGDAHATISLPHDAPLTNILEYIGQVHALLAGSDQQGRVCERFLKAVAGVLPFSETAILLRRRIRANVKGPARLGEELVLTAVETRAGRRESKAARQTAGPSRTALSSHELGPIVLAEGRAMTELHGHIGPLAADLPPSGAIALPIGGGDNIFGIWIASVDPDQSAAAEPLRLIRIFADMLAQRLQWLHGSAARQGHAETAPTWDEGAALAAAAAEVSRAARLELPVAMIETRIESSKRGLSLNVERMSVKLRASLRPYDAVATGDAAGLVWHFLLPHVGECDLHKLGARIQSIFEDELDASGGLEERGIRLGLGVSLFGADAADAAQLVAHAAEAAGHALAVADPSAVQFHFGFDPQADAL